ncbi:class I SAM-dependent methyltransferase [Salipiger sp. 1_MG-2023]|uniref:class I SAM-dependent methyltransferase n=1 Tax=Salipiger sp. 1_MG-2023 TaxID=3062665 RepID=UPI0026E1AECA|nr:class I SAM-dependent methyltransferase [Salipiger sp. 1_MG-2023]MDO6584216.1 class I SAM-dependent methyltransferase [Salipiger sp. 1_MG-2023]
MSDPQTLKVYAEKARDYEALAPNYPYPAMAAFVARLPAGARVLDYGCGPGLDAGYMASQGMTVDALDASPEMVALAATRPGVTATLGDFDALSAEALYDAIWASFSLLHAPRDAMPRHLAAIARALKPGGLLGLTLKEGSGEARDRLGRFYTYYTETELRPLLDAAGLSVMDVARGSSSGLDGSAANWISVTAHA